MNTENAEVGKLLNYTLGNIPDAWAWAGTALTFKIDTQSLDGYIISMTVDEKTAVKPKGDIKLDENGVFTYLPNESDNRPFFVEFSASIENKPITQRCQISPIPLLADERVRVVSHADFPARESTNYLTITTRRHADLSEDHFISGVRVVFDQNNDENHLWESYHIDRDKNAQPEQEKTEGKIRNLIICADEIVVYGELCIPETNISLFARRLILRNQNDRIGSINTRPLNYKNQRPPMGTDGAQGRKAGDISVYIHDFETDTRDATHFNLHGGIGQDAGEGEDGQSGTTNSNATSSAKYGDILYTFDPPAIHFHLSNRIWGPGGAEGHSWNWGSSIWPEDGHPATKPGKPGNGGDAGNFYSNYAFTQALPSSLVAQLQQLKDKNSQILEAVETWIFDYLYPKTQTKNYDAMLNRESERYLNNLSGLLHALKSRTTEAQQLAQEKNSEQSVTFLESLAETTQTALTKVAEAKDIFKQARTGRVTPEHKRTMSNNLFKAALALRRQAQSVQNMFNTPPGGDIDVCGGNAGQVADNVFGGTRGYPSDCGDYEIKCYTDPIGGLHRWSQKCIKRVTTKDGESFPSYPPDKPVGDDGKINYQLDASYANAWLHPAILQSMLIYVRDAYLTAPDKMAELQPLLQQYKTALASRPAPDILKPLVVATGTRFNETVYQNSLTEITTLLHRISSHLDYYGYPSGWTPLFSLPVCMRTYESELAYGLKALLLARWMEQKSRQATEIANIAGESIDSLNQATDQAVIQIANEKDNLHKLRDQAHALRQEIQNLLIRLDKKRNELLDKAEQDSRVKAWVNFGVSTISAVCQVIPYGQPALGALGTAGKSIANNVINGNDPISNTGPLTELLAEITKAKLDEKASAIVDAAKEHKQDSKTRDATAAAEKLGHIGSTIGPALADVSSAIQGLNVPQAEVDARLQQLEAECPEFQEMLQDLKKLNIRKAEFAQKLNESLQSLSSSYTQITSNLLAVGTLEYQRREQLAVLDHETVLYSRGMAQHARLTLTKYLYILAKCYEYAVLKPIVVKYQLVDMLDKISKLLESNPHTDTDTIQRISDKEIAPLFQLEMKKIADDLLTNYVPEYHGDVEIRLSTGQTPHLIDQLNDTGEIKINLREFDCLPSRYEQITLDDIKVVDIEFEKETPRPASGTIELTAEPCGEGTLRANNQMYVVRHPTSSNSATINRESQQIWGVRYHFGTDTTEAICPSKASLELLDTLLGDTKKTKTIKEKIAKPAAWTDVTIRYTRFVQAPPLKSVRLHVSCNWREADKEYFALDVRMQDQDNPFLNCSPPDVNGRGDGFGQIFRMYPKGTKIQLTAPENFGTRAFAHWQVFDNTDTMEPRDAYGAVLEIASIEHNMMVRCVYREQVESGVSVMMQPAVMRRVVTSYAKQLTTATKVKALEVVTEEIELEEMPQEQRQQQLELQALIAGDTKTWQHEWSNCMTNEPDGISISYLPPDAQFTILEGPTLIANKQWAKIDYRGVIGWVSKLTS